INIPGNSRKEDGNERCTTPGNTGPTLTIVVILIVVLLAVLALVAAVVWKKKKQTERYSSLLCFSFSKQQKQATCLTLLFSEFQVEKGNGDGEILYSTPHFLNKKGGQPQNHQSEPCVIYSAVVTQKGK
ncbi:hypothetical protein AOXY_G27702, partial [Acipenser oxyrinchus oxyrinchus]